MKVIILAGGLGTRLGSISEIMPKPMVKVGSKPIMWHIMKIYSHFGFNDFIICLGYKGEVIKDYFYNYKNNTSDFTINLTDDSIVYHRKEKENWKITLVDTGIETLKGGRIKRIEPFLTSQTNMITYGDGVTNIDLKELLNYHNSHGKVLTISGVRPPSMFGEIIEDNGVVTSFEEKPQTSKGLINGGFMVFEREMLEHLTEDRDCDFEFGPMESLAKKGEVRVYKHSGFWECADTVRDIENLNKQWKSGKALWKNW